MSNSRTSGAQKRRRKAAIEAAARCPDCDSVSVVVSDRGGYTEVAIGHDSTCPWFRAQGGGRAFKQIKVFQGFGAS
jgi:hypothetical protein